MLKKSKNKLAFTLLEIIIAIVILTIAIGAIYTLSVQTKKIIAKSEYSITAMNLAQEGLEFVRNIRDERLNKSLNKNYGWNKFLNEDLGFSGSIVNGKYLDVTKGGYVIKKLKIGKNGKFEIKDTGVKFDKKISSLDDICSDLGVYKDCIFEHINIKNTSKDEKINLGNGIEVDNFGKNFFRKIKIEKDFGETNLITVYSEIFWEDHGELQNFILEQKLGNVAIN